MNISDFMVDDGEQEKFDKEKKMMTGLAGISDSMNSAPSFGEFFLGHIAPRKSLQESFQKQYDDADPLKRKEKQSELLARYQQLKNADLQRDMENKRYLLDKSKLDWEMSDKLKQREHDLDKIRLEQGLKKSADMSTLSVPGYSLTGEVVPQKDEAEKFRKATAAMNTLNGQLDEYGNLINKNGNFEYFGDDAARMKSLSTDMQLKLKNPEQYNLGVLSGPDLELIQKQIPDPSSFGQLFTRKDAAKAGLAQLKKSLNQKVQDTAKSMGYTPGALTQDDKMALDWARKNPKDPRAKQILEMHGVQ